ncbi:MAG: hypothetical protein VX930_18240 [Pseudomonadota bacterium]|nr:hypothetical protein [Pseudomonadota bacterium]MED5358507.1 hypothetical protein [Pseudomonadota bacterium]
MPLERPELARTSHGIAVTSIIVKRGGWHGLQTANAVRDYFRKHAKDRGKSGSERYTGWGILQLPPLC